MHRLKKTPRARWSRGPRGLWGREAVSVCVGAARERCSPRSLPELLRESSAVLRISGFTEMLITLLFKVHVGSCSAAWGVYSAYRFIILMSCIISDLNNNKWLWQNISFEHKQLLFTYKLERITKAQVYKQGNQPYLHNYYGQCKSFCVYVRTVICEKPSGITHGKHKQLKP